MHKFNTMYYRIKLQRVLYSVTLDLLLVTAKASIQVTPFGVAY